MVDILRTFSNLLYGFMNISILGVFNLWVVFYGFVFITIIVFVIRSMYRG